jgi:integrase
MSASPSSSTSAAWDVRRRFKTIARTAGLPVVSLKNGGRHTAASLSRDAEVDPKIQQKTLGRTNVAMTSHYTHIEVTAHLAAAQAVATQVKGAGS